jgi:addiction module RelE/StbE family toxin
VARVIYTRQALGDLERLTEFLADESPKAARHLQPLMLSAIELLVHHPLVGRRAEAGLRELVISRGRTGYLALYSYERAADVVLVLAIRHQREAGYEEME